MMKKNNKPLTKKQMEEVQLLAKTVPIVVIAKQFDKKKGTIYRILKLDLNKPAKQSRFSKMQEKDMITRIGNGTASKPQIVKEYGISFSDLRYLLIKAGIQEETIPHKYQNERNRNSGVPDMWV